MQKPLVCLIGPTASGKTQLALQLVQQFPFEIISVDSAMVYRGMDIGTAKPTAEMLCIAPHRLINIRDPAEAYSAAQFRRDALREVTDILANGKTPLLVGGTMLYFHTLQHGLAEMPAANQALREELAADGEAHGWPVLHERLRNVDPHAADRIHPHDSQRIQRALEVYELTGKNLTAWQQKQSTGLENYKIYNVAIVPSDRTLLHERIVQRFFTMLATGLIDEVKSLFARSDLTLQTPAIRSVGYRQVWEYLQGKYSWDEMREKGIIATRQLAKRQFTWLRHWPTIIRFDSEAKNLFDQVMREFKLIISPHGIK